MSLKAERVLGWKAKYNIEDMMAHTGIGKSKTLMAMEASTYLFNIIMAYQ